MNRDTSYKFLTRTRKTPRKGTKKMFSGANFSSKISPARKELELHWWIGLKLEAKGRVRFASPKEIVWANLFHEIQGFKRLITRQWQEFRNDLLSWWTSYTAKTSFFEPWLSLSVQGRTGLPTYWPNQTRNKTFIEKLPNAAYVWHSSATGKYWTLLNSTHSIYRIREIWQSWVWVR